MCVRVVGCVGWCTCGCVMKHEVCGNGDGMCGGVDVCTCGVGWGEGAAG